MDNQSKKYGLIIPKDATTKPIFQASRNVFGSDSDSEEESIKKPVLLRPSDNINRMAKVAQEKAVLEDPTVYQYDEIYDSMVSKKEDKVVKSKESKKPRYIETLIKSANKRKIENERRIERQIQKEREQEGDEFADKEVFVTSAYKKKLEEMQLEEEKEKREEYLESIGDVTKQRDLGGFYRHLYEQKLGTEDTKEDSNLNIKDSVDKKSKKETTDKSKKRNYRKRKSSSEIKNNLSDGEIEDTDEEINRINIEDIKRAKRNKKDDDNIDADSDFSIDDSSGEESEGEKGTKVVKEVPETPEKEPESFKKPDLKLVEPNKEPLKQETIVPKEEPKPKIDIWKKRTVGEVFDQALKRYYERKAARGS